MIPLDVVVFLGFVYCCLDCCVRFAAYLMLRFDACLILLVIGFANFELNLGFEFDLFVCYLGGLFAF